MNAPITTLSDAINANHAGSIEQIPLELLVPSPTNPRKRFDVAGLVDSIRQHGVLQPILVRPRPNGAMGFEIIAGERRYRAANEAHVDTIPAYVRDIPNEQVIEIQLVENIQRNDLTAIEEGDCYRSMIQDHGYTADQIAERIGKSRRHVYDRISLTDLTDTVADALDDGKISASVAVLIARIPVPSVQERALADILQGDPHTGDPLSVRAAGTLIQQRYMLEIKRAQWPLADAHLIPLAGSCDTCPKRTSNDRERFADIRADVCTDPECFGSKQTAYQALRRAKLTEQGHTVLHGDEALRLLHDGLTLTSRYADLVALDDPDLGLRLIAKGDNDIAAWLDFDIHSPRDAIDQYREAESLPRTFLEPPNGKLVECVSLKALANALRPLVLHDAQTEGSSQADESDDDESEEQDQATQQASEPDTTPSHNDNQLASPKNDPARRSASEDEAIKASVSASRGILLEAVKSIHRHGSYCGSDVIRFVLRALLPLAARDWYAHEEDAKAMRNRWAPHIADEREQINHIISLIEQDDRALHLDLLVDIGLTVFEQQPLIERDWLYTPANERTDELARMAGHYAATAAALESRATAQTAPTPEPAAQAQEQTAPEAKASPIKPAARAKKPKPETAPASPSKEKPKAKPNKQAAIAAKVKKPAPVAKAAPKKQRSKQSSRAAAGGNKKPGGEAVAYRDEAGNTWTGRGKQPAWVRAAIESGKNLNDLRVTSRCDKTIDMLSGSEGGAA